MLVLCAGSIIFNRESPFAVCPVCCTRLCLSSNSGHQRLFDERRLERPLLEWRPAGLPVVNECGCFVCRGLAWHAWPVGATDQGWRSPPPTCSHTSSSGLVPNELMLTVIVFPSRNAGRTGWGVLRGAMAEESICVAIRVRPLNGREKIQGQRSIWRTLPEHDSITLITPEGNPLPDRSANHTFFTYDKVFDEAASTRELYQAVCAPIVSSVVEGFNGTIFAYGQTSSGKTFTMRGAGEGQEGVLHLAAQHIFRLISETSDRDFLLRVSFLEIYNENIRDLLDPETPTLQPREDPRKGVYIEAAETIITDFESIMSTLKTGSKHLRVEATAMNERSSRSHTIFRMVLESKERQPERAEAEGDAEAGAAAAVAEDDGAVLMATLNLVDLAGSESVRHTGATGQRAKEGGKINQSLLTLSRVIHALGQKGVGHINYRDSNLTRILQPSLSGNAKMAIICCVTSAERYLEETRSTLQFASRAKLVRTRAVVNEVLDDDDAAQLKRLKRELKQLQQRQAELEALSAVPGAVSLEDVSRLEAEKQQMSGRVEELEAVRAEQANKISRLTALILHGGAMQPDDQLPTAPRGGRLGRRHKRLRETWCPGESGVPLPPGAAVRALQELVDDDEADNRLVSKLNFGRTSKRRTGSYSTSPDVLKEEGPEPGEGMSAGMGMEVAIPEEASSELEELREKARAYAEIEGILAAFQPQTAASEEAEGNGTGPSTVHRLRRLMEAHDRLSKEAPREGDVQATAGPSAPEDASSSRVQELEARVAELSEALSKQLEQAEVERVLSSEVNNARATIAERDDALGNMSAAVDSMEEAMGQLQAKQREMQEQLGLHEAEVETVRALLLEKDGELQSTTTERSAVQEELMQAKEQIGCLMAALEEKTASVQQLEADRQAAVGELQGQFAEAGLRTSLLQEELSRVVPTLAEREAACSSLKDALDESHQKVAQLEEAIREKDESMASMITAQEQAQAAIVASMQVLSETLGVEASGDLPSMAAAELQSLRSQAQELSAEATPLREKLEAATMGLQEVGERRAGEIRHLATALALEEQVEHEGFMSVACARIEGMIEQVKGLEAESRQAAEKIACLSSTIAELEGQVPEAAGQELQELRSSCETLTAQVAELTDRLTESEAQKHRIEEERAQSQAQAAAMMEQAQALDAASQELEQLRSTWDALNAEVAGLRERLEQSEDQKRRVEEELAQSAEQIAALTERIQARDADCQELEELRSAWDGVNAEMSNLRERIAEREAMEESMEQERAQSREQIAALEEQIQGLLQAEQQSIAALGDGVGASEEGQAGQADPSTQDVIVQGLRNEVSTRDAQMQGLQAELEASNHKVEELMAELKTIMDSHAAIQAQLEEAQRALTDLGGDIQPGMLSPSRDESQSGAAMEELTVNDMQPSKSPSEAHKEPCDEALDSGRKRRMSAESSGFPRDDEAEEYPASGKKSSRIRLSIDAMELDAPQTPSQHEETFTQLADEEDVDETATIPEDEASALREQLALVTEEAELLRTIVSDLEGDLATARGAVGALEEEIMSGQEALQRKEERVQIIEEELVSTKQRLLAAQTEHEQSLTALQDLRDQMQMLEGSSAEPGQQLQDLEEARQAAAAEAEGLTRRVEEMTQELQAAHEEVGSLQEALAKETEVNEKLVQSLEEEIVTKQDEINALKEAVESLTESSAKPETTEQGILTDEKWESVAELTSTYTERMKELSDALNEVTEELMQKDSELGNERRKYEEAQQEISSLREGVQAASEQAVPATASREQGMLVNADNARLEAEKALSDSQSQLAEVRGELKGVEEKVMELTQALEESQANARREQERLQVEVARRESEMGQLQSRIRELVGELGETQGALELARSAAVGTEHDDASLRKHLSTLKTKLDLAESLVGKHEERIKELEVLNKRLVREAEDEQAHLRQQLQNVTKGKDDASRREAEFMALRHSCAALEAKVSTIKAERDEAEERAKAAADAVDALEAELRQRGGAGDSQGAGAGTTDKEVIERLQSELEEARRQQQEASSESAQLQVRMRRMQQEVDALRHDSERACEEQERLRSEVERLGQEKETAVAAASSAETVDALREQLAMQEAEAEQARALAASQTNELSQTVAQMEDRLQMTQDELNAVRGQLAESEAAVQERVAELEELQNVASAIHERAEATQLEVAMLREQVVAKEEALQQTEARLAQQLAEADMTSSHESQNEVAALKTEIDGKQSEMQAMQERWTSEVEDLNAAVEAAKSEARLLEQETKATKLEVSELRQSLASQQEAAEDLRRQLQDSAAAISRAKESKERLLLEMQGLVEAKAELECTVAQQQARVALLEKVSTNKMLLLRASVVELNWIVGWAVT
jgi:centromeric protein E